MTETPEEGQGLQFPCVYPVKAMGLSSEDFTDHVRNLIAPFVDDLADARISTKASSGGKYTSVTVEVVATDRDHLERIFGVLHEDDRIVWTL